MRKLSCPDTLKKSLWGVQIPPPYRTGLPKSKEWRKESLFGIITRENEETRRCFAGRWPLTTSFTTVCLNTSWLRKCVHIWWFKMIKSFFYIIASFFQPAFMFSNVYRSSFFWVYLKLVKSWKHIRGKPQKLWALTCRFMVKAIKMTPYWQILESPTT